MAYQMDHALYDISTNLKTVNCFFSPWCRAVLVRRESRDQPELLASRFELFLFLITVNNLQSFNLI